MFRFAPLASPSFLSSLSSLSFYRGAQQIHRFQTRVWNSTSNGEWETAFKAATADLAHMDVEKITYEESAQKLRQLVKSSLLRHSDIYDNPERFFLSHRLIAKQAAALGPGFWVRFTVHYNLCVGTALEIGTQHHIDEIHEMQKEGLLGCFGLTEQIAGVSSGLVVMTTATWEEGGEGGEGSFVLHTPARGAAKHWISQGLLADKMVAVCDLHIKGKSYGPHAFLMDMRKKRGDERVLVKGLNVEDMGRKTVGNDLDNASIIFDKVRVPKSALLNRYADVTKDGEYVKKVDKEKGDVPAFHMIGQRLFTGRVCVAQSALAFRRQVFQNTKQYADVKLCWSPTAPRPLSSLPPLRSLFAENEENTIKLQQFLDVLEREMCDVLRKRHMPSEKLVHAIAVAKVKVVDDSISYVHRLQNEVGSFALLRGAGFEMRDYLTCCKFAEGDSRVLMHKMARDRLKLFQKKQLNLDKASWDEETHLCNAIHLELQKDPSGLDQQWQNLDRLSSLIIDRTIREFTSS